MYIFGDGVRVTLRDGKMRATELAIWLANETQMHVYHVGIYDKYVVISFLKGDN